MAATQNISFPLGAADVQTPAYASTITVPVTDLMTVVSPAVLTGALTINLTIDQGIRAGARLVLIALSDGTARTVTFGTGFTYAATLTGVISKTKAIEFIYDGITFKALSAGVQID